jgi:hypothetical protein
MQLTAAAVTPPAEHAARRPAGAADAAAADAGVSLRGAVRKNILVRIFSAAPSGCDHKRLTGAASRVRQLGLPVRCRRRSEAPPDAGGGSEICFERYDIMRRSGSEGRGAVGSPLVATHPRRVREAPAALGTFGDLGGGRGERNV